MFLFYFFFFFFSSRRRHTRLVSDWSSDVCSSDLTARTALGNDPTSRRACSRNCLASETSSGAVTRPPRGVTPIAYSFAASEAAATIRRDTDNESVAWPPAGATTQALNSKPKRGLR